MQFFFISLACVLFENVENIGRRHHDRRGPEIFDQCHLPVGHAAKLFDHARVHRVEAVMLEHGQEVWRRSLQRHFQRVVIQRLDADLAEIGDVKNIPEYNP